MEFQKQVKVELPSTGFSIEALVLQLSTSLLFLIRRLNTDLFTETACGPYALVTQLALCLVTCFRFKLVQNSMAA